MSEEINMTASTLSTTEDAFEEFQATSMYEEEQFITLSDIVSPEHQEPHSSEFSEVPYDNEVVLSSNEHLDDYGSGPIDIDINQINTVPVSDSDYNIGNGLSHDLKTTEQQTDQSVQGPAIKSRPKRGRKKKNNTNDQTQNGQTIQSEVKQELDITTTVAKPKRGKKPKQSPVVQNETSNSETVGALGEQNVSKRGRKRNSTQSLPDLTTATPPSSAKKAAGKRGRKPKTILHDSSEVRESIQDTPIDDGQHVTVNECENVDQSISNNITEYVTQSSTKNRRGRQKRQKVDHSMELTDTPAGSGQDVDTEIIKKSSRRGRQKKLVKSADQVPVDQEGNTQFSEKEDESDSLPLTAFSSKTNIKEETIYQENSCETQNTDFKEGQPNEINDNNDGDDMSLSQLKQTLDGNVESTKENDVIDQVEMDLDEEERNPMLLLSNDSLETNEDHCANQTQSGENLGQTGEDQTQPGQEQGQPGVDTINTNIGEIKTENENNSFENSLLVEDPNKRPRRQKAKKSFKFDDDSDEDPFANMASSSDDEPRTKRKKGARYYSDDEYVPSTDKKDEISEYASDSEIEEIMEEMKPKRKKLNKSQENKSPKKQPKMEGNIVNVTTIGPSIDLDKEDIEECLQSSVIKSNDDKNERLGWNVNNEFESFIAKKIQGTNIQIKKVSSNECSQNTPLEIPVLDADAQKSVERETQTNTVSTSAAGTQTTSATEITMKTNAALTPEQSEKACNFLKGIVKATSELGQLMTEKSEDFITKKINTAHVVDTFKMDYCVKKSFLLLKLAKHNIFQMEEDLNKNYEEFLKNNNMSQHLAEQKIISPIQKDNDSDCEIIEETTRPNKAKPKFNPKTVFLNKELSIKIAKKPTIKQETPTPKSKQINMKNKSTVWINDSIMVKKVKPTQSFLAQDSRNKKPPDYYVTEKMVSDFFTNYYKKLAQSVCAPFTCPDWLTVDTSVACHYFVVQAASDAENNDIVNNSDDASVDVKLETKQSKNSCPSSLLCLCMEALKKRMKIASEDVQLTTTMNSRQEHTSKDLFRLCEKILQEESKNDENIYDGIDVKNEVMSLKLICYNKISVILFQGQLHTKLTYNENHFEQSQNENHLENLQNEPSNVTTTNILNGSLEKDGPIPENSETHEELLNSFVEDEDNFEEQTLENGDVSTLSEESYLDQSCNKMSSQTPTENKIKSLLSLCLDIIQTNNNSATQEDSSKNEGSIYGTPSYISNSPEIDTFDQEYCVSSEKDEGQISTQNNVNSLLSLCVKFIQSRNSGRINGYINNEDSFDEVTSGHGHLPASPYIGIFKQDNGDKTKANVKTLFKLCLEMLQKDKDRDEIILSKDILTKNALFTPETLKQLTLNYVVDMMHITKESRKTGDDIPDFASNAVSVRSLADICFDIVSALTSEDHDNEKLSVGMTINAVNTMTEEAFHNIEENNSDEDETNCYEDDFNNFERDEEPEENNWVSQLQMQELRSCVEINKKAAINDLRNELAGPIISQIKLEPVEEPVEPVVNSTIVKTELLPHFDEMTMNSEGLMTKQERIDNLGDTTEPSLNPDVESFENFVLRNKVELLDGTNEDIFSQSGLRVRRQHEPDYNNEYDPSMSLLIPQMFEPVSVENAKGSLMESSSDDDNRTTSEKKKRGRPRKTNKKADAKKQAKELPPKEKEKPAALPVLSEVAVLTRKMRERIRQEEKKVQSSESEEENLPVRKDKERKENEKAAPSKITKENDKAPKSKSNKEKADATSSVSDKPHDDEIQCSNVDSTEQVDNDSFENGKKFTGFTAVDQNEVASYQKYVKFVYDKIVPGLEEDANKQNSTAMSTNATDSSKKAVPEKSIKPLPESNNEAGPECSEEQILPEPDIPDRSDSPLIDYEDPVEMLECEPTMPMFNDDSYTSEPKKTRRTYKAKTKPTPTDTKKGKVQEEQEVAKEDKPMYTERHGWMCYPIDGKDTKLYQNAQIILEKLPETFVETYFRYQEISDMRVEDKEVDRLINLNTLNRQTKEKDPKRKMGKSKCNVDGLPGKTPDTSRAVSPAGYDSGDTLTASDDDGANVDDETPPPVRENCDNNLAKNSLMNDSDSDEGGSKVKKEPKDDSFEAKKKSKKKAIVKEEHPESLMLTADKSMNKELNLLHAPVVLTEESSGKGPKGPSPKKHKSGSKGNSSKDRIKNDEDSSSEEEKQWVNTKEKLLKRLGKKNETAIADDAKRAKLVSEFIERRGVQNTDAKKRGKWLRRQRSARKRLEREKQMRVLAHELYGAPVDPSMMGPRHTAAQSYFKGRRNIRKVLDKKSLQRSTVIANMEEFERKRRLNHRQAALRELLGYEEGVSVLVINDEVCLEYGFREQRPLVTVHPFFTRVMKAHQYEGVKFMWDACFESLEQVESGHPGGGCILAHCMGLGKTLQVLALLHTVLTHPRVGMQRVLVCCPLSTVLNWVDEINKWIGPVTNQIKVFELSKLKKTYERAYQLEDWYTEGGIFIIGYELFRSLTTLDPELDDIRPTIVNKIRSALLDPGPDIVVCDEGHLLKNDSSVLAIAMSRVATKRRIVLTGTPMQNNLREYYCMVNFIKPNLLGTYSEYSNRFENPIMNGQHRDSSEEDIKLMKQRTHILHKVLEGCLQRQEVSVLYPYLPKKHEYTVFISLTNVQWDLYKHYVQNYCGHGASRQSLLKDFHILQKIWSHPQVLHNFQMKSRDEIGRKLKDEKLEDDLAREDLASEDIKLGATETWWLQYLDGGNKLDSLDSSNKFVVVFRILEECVALGDKVLIFSTSLITLDALEYFLKKINKWSLGSDYYRLDGSVPAEVRQKWCREFNAENNHKTKLFLISTRAGCLGLNMVAANRVIIFDTSWNPAHDIQSIFRVYRFGQKKDCYIYRLVALGTMEQKIYERSVTKQAVACRVVDEQQIDRHYNMQELTDLYQYDSHGGSVPAGVAAGVGDVALLRVARLAALHAVHEHDSLLRGSSELALPEHERLEAWQQFQQEHANKQIQNHLMPHISMYATAEQQMLAPPPLQPYPPPSVPPGLSETQPQSGKKKKKGAKEKAVKEEEPPPIPTPPPPEDPPTEPPPLNEEAEEAMVQQIMELLVHHNFQGSPEQITHLVADVRKMVATGQVITGVFDHDLAKSIASVLIANDKQTSEAKDGSGNESKKRRGRRCKKRRGRPRKETPAVRHDEPGNQLNAQPSTSRAVLPAKVETSNVIDAGRRRAAINAENQINNLTNPIIDLGDDWQGDDSQEPPERGADEDWHDHRVTTPPPHKHKRTSDIPPPVKTELNIPDSIVLSDDDEPLQKITKTGPKKSTPATQNTNEPIPLHPSLLQNNNFIKIVAHTYLEGNPLLDEDAAMLAAQYTALRAKKDIETTGKPIVSGPIYDIAVNILGIEILKKLHSANPGSKPVVSQALLTPPAPVKAEPASKKAGSAARKTEPSARKPQAGKAAATPKLKAKNTSELMQPVDRKPAVVPVGFINSGAGPIAGEAVLPLEESILPDDEMTPTAPAPAAPPSHAAAPITVKSGNIFRNLAKPLVLNALTASSGAPAILPRLLAAPLKPIPVKKTESRPPIPKLVISAGKLLPQGALTALPPQVPGAAQQAPPPSADTICLDSDEEDSGARAPPARKPPGTRRVALKSTAKPPAPAPAPAAPVPVRLTAAAPHLPLPPPDAAPAVFPGARSSPSMPVNIDLDGHKYIMIPTSQINKISLPSRSVAYTLPPPSAPQPIPSSLVNSYGQSVYQPPAGRGQPTPIPSSLVNNFGQSVYGVPPPRPIPTSLVDSRGQSVFPPPDPPPHLAPAPAPAPAPSPTPAPQTKTVCKPGDILRVTSTGGVEIINRAEDAAPPAPAPAAAAAAAPPPETRKRGRTRAIAPKPAAAPAPSPVPSPTPPPVAPAPAPSPSPPRRVSLSSSSSEDSRPSSPDDPLAILRDVVHIQAPEEAPKKPPSRTAKKPESRFVGSTSITKSTVSKPPVPSGPNKPTSTQNKTITLSKTTATSKPGTPAKPQDAIMKHINKTDTILKKLDRMLGPPTSKAGAKPTTSSTLTIDLDDDDESPSSSVTIPSKNLSKPGPRGKVAPPSKPAPGPSKIAPPSKPAPGPSKVAPPSKPAPGPSKTAPAKDTGVATKVTGTSKNIIISMTGKTPTVTTVDSSGKPTNVRVMNVEKIAAEKQRAEAKKRAAPPPPPPDPVAAKKIKTRPMTLKDFNLDDIDDIIELE